MTQTSDCGLLRNKSSEVSHWDRDKDRSEVSFVKKNVICFKVEPSLKECICVCFTSCPPNGTSY